MIISQTLHLYKRILGQSFAKFFKEYGQIQSAALAFYMIFSLPSILLIILWTAARFNKEGLVREAIFAEIGELVCQLGNKNMKFNKVKSGQQSA